MQPEKYRRKKRHLPYWERERREGVRRRKWLDSDSDRMDLGCSLVGAAYLVDTAGVKPTYHLVDVVLRATSSPMFFVPHPLDELTGGLAGWCPAECQNSWDGVVDCKSMGTGLILKGQTVAMPGFDIQNFVDNPALKLAQGDVRARNVREQKNIHLIVMHSTGGIPGGSDLRPQKIFPGFGPSSNAGERIVSSWTHNTDRPGGAHIIVDFDGRIYCCADLVTQAAYHATAANGPSVGIEVVQGHRQAELYEAQIAVAANFAVKLCAVMPVAIQRQIPKPYAGHPIARFVVAQQTGTPLSDVVGIVGHRDLTSSRGEGDPGNAVMDALETAGCEVLDFEHYEDIVTWKHRQAIIGLVGVDGIPGAQTVAALKKAGRADGLWRATS